MENYYWELGKNQPPRRQKDQSPPDIAAYTLVTDEKSNEIVYKVHLYPKKVFGVEIECPDSEKCSTVSNQYTLIKLKCPGAGSDFEKPRDNLQCFTHVIFFESDANVSRIRLVSLKSVQLEDVVPGAITTYKHENRYAALLTPVFVENDVKVFFSC